MKWFRPNSCGLCLTTFVAEEGGRLVPVCLIAVRIDEIESAAVTLVLIDVIIAIEIHEGYRIIDHKLSVIIARFQMILS